MLQDWCVQCYIGSVLVWDLNEYNNKPTIFEGGGRMFVLIYVYWRYAPFEEPKDDITDYYIIDNLQFSNIGTLYIWFYFYICIV